MSDEIRDLFHREGSTIAPARPDPAAVVSGARRRLRWRRALVASATAVAAGAAVASGSALLERDPRPPASDAARLAVQARVRLASSWAAGRGLVRDVAFGFGSVWVLREGEQTLQRIDPATNRVEEVVSFLRNEARHYSGLGVGFGRLWLVSPHGDEVAAVDPRTGEVTGRLEVPFPLHAVAAADYLWVQSSTREGTVLNRVDPATLEISGSVPMGSECCIGGIVEHDGYLWVAYSDVADTRRDPTADHEDAEFDLANELRKIDPEALAVVDAVALPGDTYRPGDTVLGDLEVAAGYLWVSHPDARLVDRVDPVNGTVESVELGDVLRPDALSWFGQKLWTWELNGSLVAPIDPVSLDLGDASDLEATSSGLPVEGAGSLWTAAGSSGERPYVLRIGPAAEAPPEPLEGPPPPDATMPPRGDLVEVVSEQEQAEIFAFRALAHTGLMHPFSPRTYLFGDSEETTRVGDAWRVGFAASDCEPREADGGHAFTCTGLSGEDPRLGNALTDTYVTVELDDGRWTVTNVEGNMPAEDRRRVVGYELGQRPEPSHWEFPAAGAFQSRGPVIEMIALWVGPYPTEAPGSVCEVSLLDARGNRVGGEPFYEEPPNRPFEHAGGVRMLDLEGHDGNVERVEVDCYQRGGPRTDSS